MFTHKGSFRKHQRESHNVKYPYVTDEKRKSRRILKNRKSFKKENVQNKEIVTKNSLREILRCREIAKKFKKFKINPCSVKLENLENVYKMMQIQKKLKAEKLKENSEINDCEKCGRSFSDSQRLINHKHFFCGSNLYSCRYCRYKTNREYILYKHVRTFHLKFEDDFFKKIIKIKDEDS